MWKKAWLIALLTVVGCEEAASIYSTSCDPVQSIRVPCSKLPTTEQVQEVLNAQQETVEEVVMVGSEGQIILDATPVEECPNKSVIVIYHSSTDQCRQIKEIINSDDFFGIPYGMYNS